MPSIVQVNVTQKVAPTPSTLQRTGAIISQGGTNTAPGTRTLLTQPSDLTPLLPSTKAITSATQTTGTATITTTVAHQLTVGDTLLLTITGVTPAAYNGTFLCTITGASTFTFPLSGSPGAASVQGVYTEADVAELTQMVTSFFAQGGTLSVYVFECGPGNATDGATYLNNWLIANPRTIYSWLVPREWDNNASFLAMIPSYENTGALTYFWVTTTLATYTAYTALMKCVNALIEAPVYGVHKANSLTALTWSGGLATATTTSAHGVAVGEYFTISGCVPVGYNGVFLAAAGTTGSTLIWSLANNPGSETTLGTLQASYYASAGLPSTEFSQAGPFYASLNYNASSSSKVGPLEFQFVFGVTPFPTAGNSSLLTTLKAANISVIGTGAEGGTANTMVLWGNMLDGNPYNYWYSVDYVHIWLGLNISNAVINGSNDPANPLYLDQAGITRLEGVGAQTLSNMVTFGLALGKVVQAAMDGPSFALAEDAGQFDGQCVINAVPFAAYYLANPGDYKIGRYAGYSVAYTPLRGFDSIVFNVSAVSFPG
jgi:hypothetical protein